MSVSFDVYKLFGNGERALVHTTASAREAREVRDAAAPGELEIVARDDAKLPRQHRERHPAPTGSGI